jgi:hypothetical protein
LCCSTLVSPRICTAARVLCATTFPAARTTAPSPRQPLRCDACDHPAVGLVWSGQQAFGAQHTSACYPSFLSTPLQQSSQSACLSCTPFNACNRYEAILLTTCFSLRRGHHLEHLLCQGCHGKRICLCSRLPLRVQTCLHRLEGCAFPASGRAIITTKTTADAWALNSRSW